VIILIAQVVRVILIVLLKILEQILGRMFVEGETGTTPISYGGGFGGMQKLFDGEDASSNGLIAMLLLGLLFVTLFIIIVSPAIRERLLLLWEQLLADLAEFFKLKKKYRKTEPTEERFTDTIENLTRRTEKHHALPSLAAFERQLSRIPTPEEKYAYAYSVYAKYMEHSHGRVLVSDTPRERTDKVRSDERYPDAGQYAEVFEELRYADEAASITGLDERLTVLHDYLRGVLQ